MDKDVKEFYTTYKDQFLNLLGIPLISTCLYNKHYIPYEYTPYNSPLRNWRSSEDIDKFLKEHKSFLMYCYKKRIPKRLLSIIASGNLLLFHKYKNSFNHN